MSSKVGVENPPVATPPAANPPLAPPAHALAKRQRRESAPKAPSPWRDIVVRIRPGGISRFEVAEALERAGVFPKLLLHPSHSPFFQCVFGTAAERREAMSRIPRIMNPMPENGKITLFQCPVAGCGRLFSDSEGFAMHSSLVHSADAARLLSSCVGVRFSATVPAQAIERTNREIMMFPSRVRTAEDLQNREKVIENLRVAVARAIPGAELLVFGSFLMGLWTKESDMDLVCMHGAQIDEAASLKRIRDTLGPADFELVLSTRVPVLRMTKGQLGFQFDITCNRDNGRANSLFMADVLTLDSRAIPLAMVVRTWAKVAQITDSRRAYLTSYALLLLVVFFLQSGVQPAVLPITRAWENIERAKSGSGWFLKSAMGGGILHQWAFPSQWKSQNTMGVSELLLRFFHFFAVEFDFSRLGIVSSVGMAMPKEQLHRRVFTTHPMVVIDPLELDFNTCWRVEQERIDEVIHEFRMAYWRATASGAAFDLSKIGVVVPEMAAH